MRKLFLPVLFSLFVSYAFAQYSVADSLKDLLKKPMNDTVRLRLLNELIDVQEIRSSKPMIDELRSLSEKGWKREENPEAVKKVYAEYVAKAWYNLAIYWYEKSFTDSALYWCRKTEQLAKQYHFRPIEADCYNGYAAIYDITGKSKIAIDYAYKAVRIYESLGIPQGQADALTTIGAIYSAQKDYKSAEKVYLEAIALGRKGVDSLGVAELYEHLALVYQKLHKYDTAGSYLLTALKLAKGYEELRMEQNILGNIGMLYMDMGKNDSAIYYLKTSVVLSEQLGDKITMGRLYTRLAMYFNNINDPQKALEYSKKAIAIAKEMNYYNILQGASQAQYKAYKKLGKYGPALEAYQQYILARDSVASRELKAEALDQKLKYEYEKKELQARSENEKKVAALTLESEQQHARKNAWILGLVFVLALTGTGVFFLYNHFRQKNLIASQKESILKQKLLVSQMNPHFIFNSLNAIQNYIFKQDSLKAGTYLSQFAELMRMILDYSRRDLIKLSEEIKLLNNYFELQQLRFEFKFSYMIEVAEELDPSEVLMPPMLAQPFIENAIEHGIFYKEGSGNVFLRISRQEDKLVYEIEDDGVGLERSMELNKQKKMEHKSLATIITKERIDSMEQKRSSGNPIEITDLAKTGSGRPGVKVKFMIPYREI